MDNFCDELVVMKTKSKVKDETVELLDIIPECSIEADVTFKVDDCFCNDNSDNDGLDPLQESSNTPAKKKFQCLFYVEDLLQQQEHLNNTPLKPQKQTAKHSKRLRLINEFKSINGLNWTREKEAGVEALPIANLEAFGKGPAASVSNVLDSWLLLFDEPILKEIVHFTNEQIHKRRFRAKKTYLCRPVDLVEMRAWLGLNYLCGLFRNSTRPGPLDELWTAELGNAIFRATISHNRFVFIAEHLSLAESQNSLEQVLKTWNKFTINCRSYYAPSAWCVIQENALCTLPTDSKNLTISMLCDAQTLYIANARIENDDETNTDSLYQLICDIKSTGRNVALSKRYMNIETGENLLQRRLTSTGVLLDSAADAPVDCDASVVHSGAARLVSHPEGYLYSNGLCSQLDAVKVHERSIQAFNILKDSVYAYDTALAKPSDWKTQDSLSLKVLHTMLNFAAFNAWILLRLSPKGVNIEQRNYLRQLGLYLTQQNLQRRLLRTTSTSTTLLQKIQICEILGTPVDGLLTEAASKAKISNGIGVLNTEKAELPAGITLASRHAEKPRRCKPCSQQKRQTKSRTRCQQCMATRCHNHLIARCYQCTGITASNTQVDKALVGDDLFQ